MNIKKFSSQESGLWTPARAVRMGESLRDAKRELLEREKSPRQAGSLVHTGVTGW